MPAGRAAADGALAGLAQLAAGELTAAVLPRGRSPVGGLGAALVDATPGPVVDIVVATAESADKALLKTALVAGWLSAGALGGRRGGPAGARAALGALGVTAGAATASRRDADAAAGLAGGLAGAATGWGAVTALDRAPSRATRTSLTAGATAAFALAAARRRARRTGLLARRESLTLPPPLEPAAPVPASARFDVEGLSALYTPPDRFYVTDVQLTPPVIDVERWRLRVGGMVDRPLELSLPALLELGAIELDATLVCVHNPVGGPRIGSARWLGIPVRSLLDAAGVQLDGEQLVARSTDGFTAGVPLEHLSDGRPAIVAVAMNGRPLPVEHGFPARLLVPGLWGADANTKWLTELEVTTWGAVRDYWDRRGWPRLPSAVRPGSRIDVPANRAVLAAGTVTVAGVAWAPPGGVEGVDVSIDDGPWEPAELTAEVAPTMWRQWRITWQARAGAHRLRVRACGRHRVQRGHREPPYPVGASGFHEIQVLVKKARPSPVPRAAGRAAAAFDDVSRRMRLGAAAVPAWRARGYPPAPRHPAPRRTSRSPFAAGSSAP